MGYFWLLVINSVLTNPTLAAKLTSPETSGDGSYDEIISVSGNG